MWRPRLPRIYLFLARVPPLIYLTAYLLAVPCFGFAYATVAYRGFYAPYAHLERQWISAKNDLVEYLSEKIRNEMDKAAARISSNTSAEVYMSHFEVGQDNLSFDLEGGSTVFQKRSLNAPIEDRLKPVILRSNSFSCHIIFHPVEDDYYARSQVDIELEVVSGDNCYNSTLDDDFRTKYKGSRPGIILTIDSDRAWDAVNLIEGFNGTPDSVGGNLWRMLYLSVVVITTLGLGDIVPISDAGRVLVGSEAMLGVLLVGLFLNAVAWRASRPNSGPP